MHINITGKDYPVDLCQRLVNGDPCLTLKNPQRKICTHCHREMIELKTLKVNSTYYDQEE